MKTWLSVIVICLLTVIASAEEPLTIGVLSNGGKYIVDKFIVSMFPGTQPLETDRTISGIAVTGHDQIDMLCSRFDIVKVEPWYPRPVRNEILRSIVERMYIFTVAPGNDVRNMKDEFLGCKDVEYSDFYDIPELCYIPDDPGVSGQWALSRIECFGAWDLIRGDTTANVVISINDTGVYHTHPDLRDNMWINGPEDINGNGIFDNFSEGQGGDLNNQDEDDNGYPDDVVGYDLGRNDPNPAEDTPTHGTHVAGCASEVADNGIGGAGPGFAAKIQAAKITNASGDLTQGYQAMVYAANCGVDIINCSWGSPSYSGAHQNIINGVYTAGTLLVCAAGNDDYWDPPFNNYPSAYNHVLAVASTDPNDHLSSFSNYHTWVDICAPGSNIYATWSSNSYMNLSGTSMSSPITAGVAALVKAQNPNFTPDQLANALIGAADDIYDLNPGYEGMLGSGRLNAHAALGASTFPNIRLLATDINQITDDGDGVINPGETIELVVVMENLWQDALNTVLTLRAPLGITVTDSVSNLGTFPGGGEQMDNMSDPFTLTFNQNCIPDSYDLTLIISADGPYNIEEIVTATVSLSQANFPISLPDGIESHPLICDFDGDGQMEILVGCNDGKVYAIERNGTISPGWPYELDADFTTGPAVGDLNNDGDFEVVITTEGGKLVALDHQGNALTGFPIVTGGSLFSTPVLADLDNNGDLEIIQANYQTKHIDIYNHDGSVFGDWPYISSMAWYGSPAVGDIDGDDELEIVIGGFNDSLHVFNPDKTEIDGFPIGLDDRVWVSPAIGNIDPADVEPEIVINTQSGMVYLVNHDGSMVSGWPVDLSVNLKSSPSLGDLDGDGSPEIVFGANNANLYAYDSDGSILNGFPVPLTTGTSASAVIGDISGDGVPDIIIANGSTSSFIYAFDAAGQTLPNFPIPTPILGQVAASPAIWDLDHDGDIEIVVCMQNSGMNLEVIDYKPQASLLNIEWSAYGNDLYRCGNYEGLGPVSIEDSELSLPLIYGLQQNYPNPFNSNTIISYALDSPAEISLEIYDLLGRLISTLDSGLKQAGNHEIVWNGLNASSQEVASGIYFYRLKAGDKTSVKKMTYIR